jgi:hypothetical protein
MSLEDEISIEYRKLQQSEENLQSEISKIQKSSVKFSNWAWGFVFVGLIITVIGLIVIVFFPTKTKSLTDYGSFAGGAVSSLWSLAGLFFIYVAFLGQRQQLLIQQLEIKFSQLELKSTRLELEGQKNQMIEQNITLKQQRFENTFFQLLGIHTSIVSSMDLRSIQQPSSVVAEGRDCFKNFYKRLRGKILASNEATIENTIEGYNQFYNDNQNNVGHFFRNLYHIMKFIDNSEVDRKTYSNFVRAQLSSHELILLFYNCISPHGNEKFKPLIEKYALLKNMNQNLVFNREHIEQYNPSAYGN